MRLNSSRRTENPHEILLKSIGEKTDIPRNRKQTRSGFEESKIVPQLGGCHGTLRNVVCAERTKVRSGIPNAPLPRGLKKILRPDP